MDTFGYDDARISKSGSKDGRVNKYAVDLEMNLEQKRPKRRTIIELTVILCISSKYDAVKVLKLIDLNE